MDTKVLLEIFRGVINHEAAAYEQLNDIYEEHGSNKLKRHSVYWVDYQYGHGPELIEWCNFRTFETYEAANAYVDGISLGRDCVICESSWRDYIDSLLQEKFISEGDAKEALKTKGPIEESYGY